MSSPNDRSPNSLAANVSASGLPWRSPKETDIPTAGRADPYLDLAHQVELLDLLSDRLNEQRGTTMIMVLHELKPSCLSRRLPRRYGRTAPSSPSGETHEVLTRENLHTIFSLKAEVHGPV